MTEPEEYLKQMIEDFQWRLLGGSSKIPKERYSEIQKILGDYVKQLKGRSCY